MRELYVGTVALAPCLGLPEQIDGGLVGVHAVDDEGLEAAYLEAVPPILCPISNDPCPMIASFAADDHDRVGRACLQHLDNCFRRTVAGYRGLVIR